MPRESSASSAPASTWSPFIDPDVFPNSLEYWGPTGIPCSSATCSCAIRRFRASKSNLMVALARPGASGDQGVYADRVELDGITPRFPLPDFVGAYKYSQEMGLRPNRWNTAADQVG